ncbi:AraC family transcriptional regulator [Paenibacillus vortex V453]|uniref:AraC family transcriptional regulator n=1 Tax=Paenibacillus vortex V453 TaxID=715225 RepID=A0A2R9SZP2_9BACL|nr:MULTISPECIES: AraC family transcriptional regulator [Paenibacillus]AWP29660.1 AraC family transcriptional regulator [Paenibacillus sp. Cedars]EFU42823.1 AraC family transcriptional regulator [Paenibacillus vortex V453]MDH6673285.1 AraC-like DNA-binding protein [Paenibacillus sp. LBL]
MSTQLIIQKSIAYMEQHLEEQLTLADIASHAGFSPYHFHRLFRKEVGMNIADYLRKRRLCYAAQLLLHSEAAIIDISFHCHFESQESFTRAFKKLYGMPPGRYRKIFAAHAHHSIFEQGDDSMQQQQSQSALKGWFLSGSHPQDYEIGIDRTTVHQGSTSGYLKAVTPMDMGAFATMMQQFKAGKFVGKRMRFSGFVKTENVKEYCGLWMRVDSHSEDVLQFDNMNDRRIVGSTNWNHYAIVLDVPEDSATISIGVLLMGAGQVWVDSFRFEEVDRSVPTTNLEVQYEMLEEPANLSFEE